VALSTSALPSGVTAAFAPGSTTGTSSTLTFTAAATAATGTSTVTISGTGGTLTRTTTVSLTIAPVAQANFTLSTTPSTLTVSQGASGASTIGIARTNFTGSVALSTSALPGGVTASFAPGSTTGNSSTLTFTAAAGAATGTSTVTVTGTGGTLTRTTTVALTIGPGGGGGDTSVTVSALVTSSSPWFNEQQVRVNNTATLTALSVTIVVQRTTGISASGQYNNVGGQITQGSSSTATAITYQFTLSAGQTLGMGSGRTFAAQTSGTGTTHPTAGDTWTVTYTTGGQTFTRTGTF
jgi:hypothetical protein